MRRIFFPSSKPTFIDEKKIVEGLKKIALKVVRQNKNAEAIYLFGSYANRTAGLHSDADILVVLKEDKRRPQDRADDFILTFSKAPVPVDVLVKTRLEVDLAIEEGSRFFLEAIKGVRLAGN